MEAVYERLAEPAQRYHQLIGTLGIFWLWASDTGGNKSRPYAALIRPVRGGYPLEADPITRFPSLDGRGLRGG